MLCSIYCRWHVLDLAGYSSEKVFSLDMYLEMDVPVYSYSILQTTEDAILDGKCMKRGYTLKKYNTIIFDLDGTLLNTLEDLTDAVNYVMGQFHFEEKTVSQVRSFVGNGIRKLMERCVPGGQEREGFEEIFQCFRSYYTAHCQEKTKPYDGILELLQALSDCGYRMGIVSNKNDKAVEELNEVFFSQYITVAIGQNDKLRPKPAPDTVDMALKCLDCNRESALYVGDSDVDKATADNSNMDCVSVTWGFRDRELLEKLKPAAVIDEPLQLLEYLGEKRRK